VLACLAKLEKPATACVLLISHHCVSVLV